MQEVADPLESLMREVCKWQIHLQKYKNDLNCFLWKRFTAPLHLHIAIRWMQQEASFAESGRLGFGREGSGVALCVAGRHVNLLLALSPFCAPN